MPYINCHDIWNCCLNCWIWLPQVILGHEIKEKGGINGRGLVSSFRCIPNKLSRVFAPTSFYSRYCWESFIYKCPMMAGCVLRQLWWWSAFSVPSTLLFKPIINFDLFHACWIFNSYLNSIISIICVPWKIDLDNSKWNFNSPKLVSAGWPEWVAETNSNEYEMLWLIQLLW